MTWSEEAACTGTSLSMWFPGKGAPAKTAYTTARWYCDRCPVRRECLAEALRIEALPGEGPHGMRAGLMPDERDAIHRGEAPVPTFPAPIVPVPPIRPKEKPTVTVTDITPAVSQPKADAHPATAEELIAWGAAHQSSRIQGMAGKAHRALTDLRQEAERQTRVAESEARVERLRAQLANAERDLRSAKSSAKHPQRPQQQPSGSRPARGELPAIRAWARENGYDVAPAGIIARTVVDAYRAAQQAA